MEIEVNLNALIKKVEKFYPIYEEFKSEVNIKSELREIKLNQIYK